MAAELPNENVKVRGTGIFDPPKARWYRIASQPNPTQNTPTYIDLSLITRYTHTPTQFAKVMIQLDGFSPSIYIVHSSCGLGSKLTVDKIRITQKDNVEQGPCYLDIHIAVPDNYVNIVMSTLGVYDNNGIIVNKFVPVEDAPQNETVIKTCNIAAMPSGSAAVAVPPMWHDLQLADTFVPDGSGAVNQYCKDQFGRVTVRLQCKTVAEGGTSSEPAVTVLPAGFRPGDNRQLTYLFKDGASAQVGYLNFYPGGRLVAGRMSGTEGIKKINCEFSYFAE